VSAHGGGGAHDMQTRPDQEVAPHKFDRTGARSTMSMLIVTGLHLTTDITSCIARVPRDCADVENCFASPRLLTVTPLNYRPVTLLE
jgi:hypothetical protein